MGTKRRKGSFGPETQASTADKDKNKGKDQAEVSGRKSRREELARRQEEARQRHEGISPVLLGLVALVIVVFFAFFFFRHRSSGGGDNQNNTTQNNTTHPINFGFFTLDTISGSNYEPSVVGPIDFFVVCVRNNENTSVSFALDDFPAPVNWTTVGFSNNTVTVEANSLRPVLFAACPGPNARSGPGYALTLTCRPTNRTDEMKSIVAYPNVTGLMSYAAQPGDKLKVEYRFTAANYTDSATINVTAGQEGPYLPALSFGCLGMKQGEVKLIEVPAELGDARSGTMQITVLSVTSS